MERFGLGDHYDVNLEENHIATVTLTTLLGCETDEGAGNDSYIGALATLSDKDLPYFMKDYYALQRHHEREATSTTEEIPKGWIRLEDEPVPFNLQAQIVELLTQRVTTLATDAQRQRARTTSPVLRCRRSVWEMGTCGTTPERSGSRRKIWIAPVMLLGHGLPLHQHSTFWRLKSVHAGMKISPVSYPACLTS